ncbi:MAG: ATP-binding cassette domain-containing protein, partial [Pyrinomonadaceae bacterium]
MKFSPMLKVQSPKSDGAVPDARENQSDVGHRTLDIRLRVTDLRKSFLSPAGERLDVLRGVSFSVAAGETLAIMGPSGAGKSTLLHLMGGLEEPDHGSIVVGSFEVGGASLAALARFRGNQLG